MQLYLPLTWDLFRSKVHSLSQLIKLKAWGMGQGMQFVGNGVVQESGRRSKNPLNKQVT
jgi:hypothetical protein